MMLHKRRSASASWSAPFRRVTALAVSVLVCGLAVQGVLGTAQSVNHAGDAAARALLPRSLRNHPERGLGVGPENGMSRVGKRDASTRKSGGDNNEGEAHGAPNVPDGAKLRSLKVGSKQHHVAVYWSTRSSNSKAEQAFVMIHGRLRNGNEYWQTMENALLGAVKDKYPGASNNSIVTAPQFYSTRYNSGQYKKKHLAWDDVNAWQAGEIASHPKGTSKSALDVLDAFVQEFSDKDKYPNMKNITLVGHGGGGQLMQRYAVIGKDPPSDVHVRYIYGDPSSSLYFTKHRPKVDKSVASKDSCPWFNHWRYGFTNFTDVKPNGGLKPIDYFAQYVKRDVVSLVGYKDTKKSGDQYCMAKLQGGNKRRDRNLAYWKYINTLARTNFDMTGFDAEFGHLPDWSRKTGHSISHRLLVIEDADHDANLVFGGDEGRAALFSSGDLPTGWRPKGWNAKGTGKYRVKSVDDDSDGDDEESSSSKGGSSSSKGKDNPSSKEKETSSSKEKESSSSNGSSNSPSSGSGAASSSQSSSAAPASSGGPGAREASGSSGDEEDLDDADTDHDDEAAESTNSSEGAHANTDMSSGSATLKVPVTLLTLTFLGVGLL